MHQDYNNQLTYQASRIGCDTHAFTGSLMSITPFSHLNPDVFAPAVNAQPLLKLNASFIHLFSYINQPTWPSREAQMHNVFLPRDALQYKARSCDRMSSVRPSVCL